MSTGMCCDCGKRPAAIRGRCKRCYERARTRGQLDVERPAEPRPATVPWQPPPEWTEKAACQYVDPELWFPGKGDSTWEAKRICHSCPVAAECLEYALEHREPHGIWGGMSARQREKEVKRRAAAREERTAA